jgi:hypothetical protein
MNTTAIRALLLVGWWSIRRDDVTRFIVLQASHQGSHGIKYSKLSVASDGEVVAASASSTVELAPNPASPVDQPLTPAESEAASARVDAQYAALDEPDRWRQFIAELDRLDAVPVTLDPFNVEPRPTSPAVASDPTSPVLSDGTRLSDAESGYGSTSSCPRSCQSGARSTWSAIQVVLSKTCTIFEVEHRSTSLKLFATWFFLAFAYYGLTLWMPSYFANRNRTAGDDAANSTGDMDMYLTAVVGSLSALPANVASIFTVRIYGRIRTLVISLLLSGICVLLVPVVSSPTAAVVMLCVFSGVNTASWNALNISTTELYHTEIRATAFG